jgi:Rrf2 family protein
MKLLSISCGNALRALTHIAGEAGNRPLASRHITAAGGIPDPFLRKVLRILVSAQVLRSGKGPNGGYSLARPASEITLLEVVEAVDGPIRGVAPLANGGGAGLDARLEAACTQAADEVRRRLGKVRLSDLANK